MISAYVSKRNRAVAGKRREAACYTLFYKLPGEKTYRTEALGVRQRDIAEDRKRKRVAELEQELNGWRLPKGERLASVRLLTDHVDNYIAELEVLKRSAKYTENVGNHLRALISGCGWRTVADVSAESFMRWRLSRKVLKPKTLNTYLADALAFVGWVGKLCGVGVNPLLSVQRVDDISDASIHRAFADAEMCSLLAVAGDRKVVYLLAALTGLRRNEMDGLCWGDVHLDAAKPFVLARASTTKNGKAAAIGLRSDVVRELVRIRPCPCDDEAPVFVGRCPSMAIFRSDLKAAGIRSEVAGRKAVFHSLRHTLATGLARAKVAPQVAKLAMRHSDMNLTLKVYTDVAMLPVADVADHLPLWASSGGVESLALIGARRGLVNGTVKTVLADESMDAVVRRASGGELLKRPAVSGDRQRLSGLVQQAEQVPLMGAVGFEPTKA